MQVSFFLVQGENDEIDVVSMDTKSPGTREEEAVKSPDEDIILEAMVDDGEGEGEGDGEDEESHVTITHEDEEGVKEENVDVEEEDEAEGAQCYCEGKGEGPMLPCEKCKKSFHLGRNLIGEYTNNTQQ